MAAPPPVPALPDSQRITTYSITAQTGPFNVNFALFGDGTDFGNWIEVWLNAALLNPATDFTVTSPSGSPLSSLPLPISDAQVTLTAASTGTLVIVGARRPRRLTQFSESRGVAARDLNEAFTDIIAEMREEWDRTRTRMMAVPAGEAALGQFPAASFRANTVFNFDSSGRPLFSPVTISGGVGTVTIGVVHYVNTSGNDGNAGTFAAPWATIAKVNASTFNPGDSVLFQGGQTFSGSIISPSAGTPSAPITFGSYGGGQATISSGTSDGFVSTNQAGIIVRDLIFTGSSGTNRGIHFTNSGSARLQNVQAINCTVSGYGFDGIFFSGSVSVGYDHILVDGCTVSGCTAHTGAGAGATVAGILIGAAGTLPAANTNVVVSNCTSHDNLGVNDTSINGNGIVVEETTGGLITHCLAYNNGTAANGPAAIWCNDCVNVIIDSCTAHNQGTGNAIDGDGFDIDIGSVGCTIRNCLSYNNVGFGFFIIGNITAGLSATDQASIINCVSINDATAANAAALGSIALHASTSNSVTNVTISGCKVYQSKAGTDAINIGGGSANTITGTVTGNTFSISAAQNFINAGAFNPTGLLFTNNDYRSAGAAKFIWNSVTYTAIDTFAVATGQESAGRGTVLLANPIIYGSVPLLIFRDTETNGSVFQLAASVNGTTPYFGSSLNKAPFPDLWAVNFDNLGSFQLESGSAFGWSSNATSAFANMDTGISRIAPVSSVPTIAIGNGTPADASGTMKAKTKAGAPTAADVPAGTWTLIRDTTNNTTKLYYNNAGTLQVIALA